MRLSTSSTKPAAYARGRRAVLPEVDEQPQLEARVRERHADPGILRLTDQGVHIRVLVAVEHAPDPRRFVPGCTLVASDPGESPRLRDGQPYECPGFAVPVIHPNDTLVLEALDRVYIGHFGCLALGEYDDLPPPDPRPPVHSRPSSTGQSDRPSSPGLRPGTAPYRPLR